MTIRQLIEKLIVDYKAFKYEDDNNYKGICMYCLSVYNINIYNSEWVNIPNQSYSKTGHSHWVNSYLPFHERTKARITIMEDILSGKYNINLEDKA